MAHTGTLLVRGMHDLRGELAPRADRRALPQQDLPGARLQSANRTIDVVQERRGTHIWNGDHEHRDASEERAAPVVRQLREELRGEEREHRPHHVA